MALARCYIFNGKARSAWELYLKMETSHESFNLLQLIANDCYKMGQFFFSLKAFDVLERLDPNPEYWEGKRGACAGAFQKIVAGKEPRDTLREITLMLRNTSNPQVEYYMRTFKVRSPFTDSPLGSRARNDRAFGVAEMGQGQRRQAGIEKASRGSHWNPPSE